MSEDIFKSIGQIGASIGGAILGSIFLGPGFGTALGTAGGAALGGGLGGMAGNTLGSLLFKQQLPDIGSTLMSGAGGALSGGLGAFDSLKATPKLGLTSMRDAASTAGSSMSPTLANVNAATMPLSQTPSSGFGSTAMRDAMGVYGSSAPTIPMTQDEKFLAALSSMKPQQPTTKQLVYQGLLTGAAPAAATVLAGSMNKPRESEPQTYGGGAKSWLDEIRTARMERRARARRLGLA